MRRLEEEREYQEQQHADWLQEMEMRMRIMDGRSQRAEERADEAREREARTVKKAQYVDGQLAELARARAEIAAVSAELDRKKEEAAVQVRGAWTGVLGTWPACELPSALTCCCAGRPRRRSWRGWAPPLLLQTRSWTARRTRLPGRCGGGA